MKKLRKRLKTYYYKHWNCLPWFICGLMILIRGDISRFNYGSMWIALLIMMWFFCPTEDINKLSETESKGDDDMLVLPIKKKMVRHDSGWRKDGRISRDKIVLRFKI